MLVTRLAGRKFGVGGRLALGWLMPCGGLPQFLADDLEGARDRDGKQGRHEAAEQAA